MGINILKYKLRKIKVVNMKSKLVAGLLAIFLGGFGIHKFYLGQTGQGILMLLFAWTGIPEIIGIFQGVLMLLMTKKDFDRKYN